jgi:LacI family transcriptional regulator
MVTSVGRPRSVASCGWQPRSQLVNLFTMQPPKEHVTLEEVAQAAGVAKATVSYALRQHPKIPATTRDRILRVATSLGYRPNPRVSSLMAQVRQGSPLAQGERIAFVWMQTPRSVARRDPFLRAVFAGASQRAQQAGFSLEEFFTADPGMTDRRLGQIIRARGIVGVVLSPVMTDESHLALDWDWSGFAAAVIGNVSWTPELHHAGHHHYLGMRTVLLELAASGHQRIAAAIDDKTNRRAKRAWEAAFLTHHPTLSSARSLLQLSAEDLGDNVCAWVRAVKPDALIMSSDSLLAAPGLERHCERQGITLATLYWNANRPDLAGIDQRYDRIAGHAIDLVIAQLNNNEVGVPELPHMMLFPGKWMAPQTKR